MRTVMEAKGAAGGCIGDQISWPIDMLVPGDVYVADTYGKVDEGPIIGDNLATAIYANSGNGVVFDGSVRDLEGIEELEDFACFVRGWHPSYASPTIMLLGVNTAVRIGQATVMPGDVVLGKREGVVFIPPHLAETVVKTSELVQLRDMFGKQRLREGKYTPGQIDDRWTDEMEADFSEWLEGPHGRAAGPEGGHPGPAEGTDVVREIRPRCARKRARGQFRTSDHVGMQFRTVPSAGYPDETVVVSRQSSQDALSVFSPFAAR